MRPFISILIALSNDVNGAIEGPPPCSRRYSAAWAHMATTPPPHTMTRLQSEWRRLYGPPSQADDQAGLGSPDTPPALAEPRLIDAQGRVRALVLALGHPADWQAVHQVWLGVQTDLGLPAPAIAVSGQDAYQLWFSVSQPVSVHQAQAFLQALCARYLGQLAPSRLTLLPTEGLQHATAIPAQMPPANRADAEQWSAFVAPDLAPMFAETPWLDVAPSPEGQAELLSRLHSTPPAAWQAALARLQPPRAMPTLAAYPGAEACATPCLDPRQFLLNVMNDASAPLGLRIDAAKALLPRTPDSAGPHEA